jgi:hypothetical protein
MPFDTENDHFTQTGSGQTNTGRTPTKSARVFLQYTWGADTDTSASMRRAQPNPHPEEIEVLERLAASDPLTQPSDEEKTLLYKYRHYLKDDPRALAKLMLSINWLDTDQIREARRMLKQWAPLSPTQALDLLGAENAQHLLRHFILKIQHHFAKTGSGQT